MKINTKACYSLDLLCFLNCMTADPYYADIYKAEFDRFYPNISEGTRDSVRAMVAAQGYSMLSPTLTLLISALKDFEARNLSEMLGSQAEIRAAMGKTPYIFSDAEFDRMFARIDSAILPLVAELELAGFADYWQASRLPLIEARRAEVDGYMKDIDVEALISQYRSLDSADFTVYLCTFAQPHGIKLCGNNLISDCAYPNVTVLSNVTHEAFHPAFDYKVVDASLRTLSQKPWVQKAFAGQDPNSGYHSMDGFIEEHIVEALGIYVLVRLGVDLDVAEYFRKHDHGSHVISPYFYQYLCENEKLVDETFEAYFDRFVQGMDE